MIVEMKKALWYVGKNCIRYQQTSYLQLEEKEDKQSDAEIIINEVIEWLINTPVDGLMIEFKFSYLIEQEYTPTVKFEDDLIYINSPNNVLITLREDSLTISLDSEIIMNFNPEGGSITEVGKEDDTLKMNFLSNPTKDDDVIMDYKHFSGEARILGNGDIRTRVSIGLDPDENIRSNSIKKNKPIRERSVQFLKSNQEIVDEGNYVVILDDNHRHTKKSIMPSSNPEAINEENEIDELNEEFSNEKFIFRPDDHIVRNVLFFHPNFFIDDNENGYGFEIHTQKHLEKRFPDKDQTSIVVFKDMAHLNPISTLDDFKVALINDISNTEQKHECFSDSFIEKVRSELKGKSFGYSCFFICREFELKQYLQDRYDDINLRITIIIDDCLRRKTEQIALQYKRACSNCEKVKEYRNKLKNRKYRQAIYQGMLQTKTFPKYHHFKNYHDDIRAFNVCEVVNEIKTKTNKMYNTKF